ncbi:hypothetical protein CONCODRAFT_78292 [Conidiobolus coronatus NRRL 28638]|uniref:ATPase inhibitor, mitochondrial n=1 Tax=Conidiobolus coronatus (strain ATCC 28846 / CBS 209.66 / NRRL 28638) TaxID=796925 RepID=A0A137P948_CONC2|nr:hypothetical protein CONCODRAFT_78292 [Conidiobolus coronatus NRRL 28638]|eukprot:KXN71536.1 hypothetical protein CONCODRAFT_78292 [Conidiobolus coronatus NRRL 28638]
MYSQEDKFSEREKAAEDLYVREHEKEKAKKLKEQLEKLEREKQELEGRLKKK